MLDKIMQSTWRDVLDGSLRVNKTVSVTRIAYIHLNKDYDIRISYSLLDGRPVVIALCSTTMNLNSPFAVELRQVKDPKWIYTEALDEGSISLIYNKEGQYVV